MYLMKLHPIHLHTTFCFHSLMIEMPVCGKHLKHRIELDYVYKNRRKVYVERRVSGSLLADL